MRNVFARGICAIRSIRGIRHIGAAGLWCLALSCLQGPAHAASITEGILGGESRIYGRFLSGDMESVTRKFPQGLDRPVQLGIDPSSAPAAVTQLGDWLRMQKPMLDIDEACIGWCAWLLSNSGRALGIRHGAVIAFDTVNLLMLVDALHERIDAGDVFADAPASIASRTHFLEKTQGLLAEARAFKNRTQQLWPAPMLGFTRALAGPLTQAQLIDDDEHVSFSFEGSGPRCFWWVPDAQGLRQIGLEVPGYEPPPREKLAKLLKVKAEQIYIGPMLQTLPAEGLCAGH